MSRNELHSEENFWPCVSDMFLALFVIALVMYSTVTNEQGRGERYIAEQALKEACQMFKELDIEAKEKDLQQEFHEATRRRHFKLPLLAAELDKITKNVLRSTPADVGDYAQAVRHLYRATFSMNMPQDDIYYDDRLRQIREKLIILGLGGGNGNGATTLDNLQAELKRLKDKRDALIRERDNLTNGGDSIQSYEERIQKLNEQIAQIETLETRRLDAQKELDDIRKLMQLDNRVVVMKRVRELLKSHNLSEKVHINMDKGTILIPFSFIRFKDSDATDINNANAKDVLNTLSTKAHNIKLLAFFLDSIGKEVRDSKLPVDNISIECIQPVKNGSSKNKIAQNLRRAYGLWRFMNETQQNLSRYKNAGDLGLYSLSGSGGKTDTNEHSVLIRFNCSPTIIPKK